MCPPELECEIVPEVPKTDEWKAWLDQPMKKFHTFPVKVLDRWYVFRPDSHEIMTVSDAEYMEYWHEKHGADWEISPLSTVQYVRRALNANYELEEPPENTDAT